MYNIEHKPTYYPIPYAIGIDCPAVGCGRTNPNYCYNRLKNNWTWTDDKEQYVFFHPKRKTLSIKYLPEIPAYYHLKTGKLSDGEYLIGRYYPQRNMIVEEGTGELFSRDLYTFHGFLYSPQVPKRGVKWTGTSGDTHISEELDFNF